MCLRPVRHCHNLILELSATPSVVSTTTTLIYYWRYCLRQWWWYLLFTSKFDLEVEFLAHSNRNLYQHYSVLYSMHELKYLLSENWVPFVLCSGWGLFIEIGYNSMTSLSKALAMH